ncbi:MAG TPA: endonuclease/exonuclease/phosphatase family protein [Vicinamibacterales bacterium]|nr:endonuclease/exonuclease/phosphatase family protein [Vicinamibacterales bacterium]
MARVRTAIAAVLTAATALGGTACIPFYHPDRTSRVLVFNIHAGKDAANAPNLDDVAALMRTTGASVALLQEVDRHTVRSGKVDQVQALMKASGFDGEFGQTLDYDGGQYGIATFARDRVDYILTFPLRVLPPQARAGGSHEPRGALVTVDATPSGRWQSINTHLDPSNDDTYRRQEVQDLLHLVRQRLAAGLPMIVGGDFNSTPDNAVQQTLRAAGLRDAWTECGQGDGFTYPANAPAKRIDYLFLTGNLHCASAQVLDTRISDHRPLLVTMK